MFRRREYYLSSSSHDSKRFEEDYLHKHGRPYYKPYEDGDEEKRLAPVRGYQDLVVYQRYKKTVDNLVYESKCCTYGGYICATCAPLNESPLFDIKVPLCPEDWGSLLHVLTVTEKWDKISVYAWVRFWVWAFENRLNWRESKNLVSFDWNKFSCSRFPMKYHFFRYIYDFVMNKTYKKPYRDFYVSIGRSYYSSRIKITFETLGDNLVRLSSCNACLKFSMDIYGSGRVMEFVETKFRKHSIFRVVDRPPTATLLKNWIEDPDIRKAFDDVKGQITGEVAFRPQNAGYDLAMEDFDLCRHAHN